jgi:hypothetical protein
VTFEPYGVGLCYASVCTDLSDEEATARLNLTHPTGVTPWQVSDEPTFSGGEANPAPCSDSTTCRHVLFVC